MIWLTNHYTYYNDYLFDYIQNHSDISLFVRYRKMTLDSHPWSEEREFSYENIVMDKNFQGLDMATIAKALFTKDYFVIAGWNFGFYIFIASILSIRNRPFAIFSDTPKESDPSFKQWLKLKWLKFIFRKRGKASLLVTGGVGKKVAIRTVGIPEAKIYNFPFVTDNKFFAPDFHSNKDSFHTCKTFLSVGRIVFSHKGQDVAIKAFHLLEERGIRNYKYVIAGNGEDMEKLERMISDYGMSKQIFLLGWREIEELPTLFNNTHFTLHSSHDDPFPNVVLESLSCGIPVIGSDKAGSVMERVESGINGFIHKSNDPIDLADKMEKAISLSEAAYATMRENSRRSALKWGIQYNIDVLDEVVK